MGSVKKNGTAASVHQRAGDLMGVVRECFYAPDGKAPLVDGQPYDDGRDMSILRYWLKKGGDPARIEAAIRGTALMRDKGELGYIEPGEKLTLRILNPKTSRYGRHQFQAGADRWEQHQRDEARRKGRHALDAVGDDELVSRMANALKRAKEAS